MSRFKEIRLVAQKDLDKQLAQDKQVSAEQQLLRRQEKLLVLTQLRIASEKKDQERITTKEEASKILNNLGISSLLNEIRKDVWGGGKVKKEPLAISLEFGKEAPFGEKITYTKSLLRVIPFSPISPAAHYTDKTVTETKWHYGIQATSILRISTEKEQDILTHLHIWRGNTISNTPFGVRGLRKKFQERGLGYYYPDYKTILEPLLEQNPNKVVVNKDYLSLDLSTPNLQSIVIDSLSAIIREDTLQQQLPKQFHKRAREIGQNF